MLRRLNVCSKLTLIVILAVLPLVIYGAWHVQTGNALAHEWLPRESPEREAYDRFIGNFGDDQFILVTWQGCRLDDPRLTAFRDAVRSHAHGPSALIERADSSGDFLAALTRPPLELSQDAARARLTGALIGDDGTCLVIVKLTLDGTRQQSQSLETIRRAADSVDGLGRDRLLLAGTIYEALVVDEAGALALRTFVLPSTLFALVVAWISLGSARASLVAFALAGFGQLTTLALLWATGGKLSAVLTIVPTLVFMLSLSTVVHLVNYHRDALRGRGAYAGVRAMLQGLRPCVLASLTTAIGMGSLLVSQLAPVRNFGVYASVGLVIATTLVLAAFPALVDLVVGNRPREATPSPRRHDGHHGKRPSRATAYVAFLDRHARAVSLAGVVLLGVTAPGALWLQASTKFDRMFPKDGSVIQGVRWIEDHIGPLVSIEVLLEFDTSEATTPVARARWVSRVEQAIREVPEVGGVLAASTFLPSFTSGASLRGALRRAVLNRQLESHRRDLAEDGWLAEDGDNEVWRITAKVSGLQDEDYGFLTEQVRAAVDQEIASMPEGITLSVVTTGLSPVIHEAQVLLMSDLGTSFMMAFLLITPVMMVVVRGFVAGLLAMIPNVLPVVVVFGMMGWLGVRLDIAGMLTASIAMGIAVDDTLHFLNWFGRARREGATDREAVSVAFDTCARAMLQTTIVSCSAMMPLMLSDFVPTQRFAGLMVMMLCGAVVGDLVLLPALILSPLGSALLKGSGGPKRTVAEGFDQRK